MMLWQYVGGENMQFSQVGECADCFEFFIFGKRRDNTQYML